MDGITSPIPQGLGKLNLSNEDIEDRMIKG
jgi:hypothetical protein